MEEEQCCDLCGLLFFADTLEYYEPRGEHYCAPCLTAVKELVAAGRY